MNLKRIFALIICLSLLCVQAFAYGTYDESFDIFGSILSETDSQPTQDSDIQSQENTPNYAEIYDQYAQTRYKDYYYRLFSQILDIYVENHLYDFSKQEVIDTMIENILIENPSLFKYFVNQMLGTMDPYSSYHEKDSKFLEVDKANTGYGIVITEKDGATYIKSILEDSAAKEAGLLAGDRIISVAGYSVDNLPYNVVTKILASPYVFLSQKNEQGKYTEKNPPCPITVLRDGQTVTFTLQKDSMTVPQVTSELTSDGKTAIVTVSSFLGENTDKLFNDLIYGYSKDGVENLTIDLRDNGGGSLEYALSMAETFVEKDAILCYYNDRKLEQPDPIYSTTEKASFKSITVLVNQNTASAAELMTSILQNHGVAKVVGTVTYGKSIGQVVYTLPSGDYITITTYEILDKNKQSYNTKGIIPDLEIENVLMCYQMPELESFNHENYVQIQSGVYSEVSLALEKRLNMIGFLFDEQVDGIFDTNTQNALKVFQKLQGIDAPGVVTHDTVTEMTDVINEYKIYDYYEDSQMDVALIVHSSFSQGKRLVKEKQALSKEHAALIEQRNIAIDEYLDSLGE